MEANNLVSVIMPAYNPDKKLLKKAVESLFEQTYPCIELVIGDDGSEIPIINYIHDLISDLRNYNSVKIIVVRSDENKGISHARNQAIAHSEGKWLVWLDSDDTLQNDCIEKLMCESVKYNLVIGECNVYVKNNVTRRKPKSYFEEAKENIGTEKDPFMLNIISLQPQLLLKSDFEGVGCFDENFHYAELTDLFLRYIYKNGLGKVNFIEGAVYNYNRNNENTLTSHREELFKNRLIALSNYKKLYNISSDDLVYIERDFLTGFQKYALNK